MSKRKTSSKTASATKPGRLTIDECRKLFPEVKPVDGIKSPADLEQHYQWLAHMAVFNRDPECSRTMRDAVLKHVDEGRPLPGPLQRWLRFALAEYGDELPQRIGPGNRPDMETQYQRRVALAKFWVDDEKLYPKKSKTDRLLDAVDHFPWSESATLKLYATKVFKSALSAERQFRGRVRWKHAPFVTMADRIKSTKK